jgi:PAS domain S-box-containing protein
MPSTSPKILCVDDEPNVLVLRKVLLGSAGYDVLVAEEGQSGLKVFRDTHVDVVVLDYKMPGMTGDEVAREMRRIRPSVPLLLVTAYVDLPARCTAIFDSVVVKGESPLRLLEEIGLALHRTSRAFTSEYIAVVDNQRRYVDVTDGVCKLVGYEKEELLRMTIDALAHPSVANTPELFQQYVRDGFQEGNFILKHKSGAPVPIRYRAKILKDGSYAAEWFPTHVTGQQQR